jgi:Ca2+/Na+ antiporter
LLDDSVEPYLTPVRRASLTPDVETPTERSPLLPSARTLPYPSSAEDNRRRGRLGLSTTNHHVLRLVTSTLALSLAGYLLSYTTQSLAIILKLEQSTLGLTLLSIATTLPEKLVAWKSGRKSQTGVLIANTVGSNVFLGTLVLGIVWTVTGNLPLTFGHVDNGKVAGIKGLRWIWVDLGMVLVSSTIMWTVVWVGRFRRSVGVGMLGLYVGYVVTIFLR